jgi:hypothetical protein
MNVSRLVAHPLALQVKDKINTFRHRAATGAGAAQPGAAEGIKKPVISLFAAIAKLANKRQTSSGKYAWRNTYKP